MDWEKGLEKEEEEDRDEERSEWLKDDVSLVGAYTGKASVTGE